MSMRIRIGLVVLSVASLAAVGLFGQTQPDPAVPTIMSGADLGFRVDGRAGNRPTGTLMVKIDGKWVEAILGKPGLQNLTSR